MSHPPTSPDWLLDGDHLADEAISASLDDALDPGERSVVDTHLAACDRCTARLQAFGGVATALTVDPPGPPIGAGRRDGDGRRPRRRRRCCGPRRSARLHRSARAPPGPRRRGRCPGTGCGRGPRRVRPRVGPESAAPESASQASPTPPKDAVVIPFRRRGWCASWGPPPWWRRCSAGRRPSSRWPWTAPGPSRHGPACGRADHEGRDLPRRGRRDRVGHARPARVRPRRRRCCGRAGRDRPAAASRRAHRRRPR